METFSDRAVCKMSENTFWVSTWSIVGTVIISITFAISYNSAMEFKVGTEHGLVQEVVGNKTIWVKSK